MGFGDELIAAGQARALRRLNPLPVRVVDRYGDARWSGIWERNPSIVAPEYSGEVQILKNGPSLRPYIADKRDERWVWQAFTPTPAELVFTGEEKAFGERYPRRVILEPHTKAKASPNKDWGWIRWSKLALLLQAANVRVTQVGGPHTPMLQGAELVQTSTFRQACAVLSTARACVLPEGGLHHAAAALDVPAVVIYGGFISPAQTGYAGQVSLFTGSEPCGMRVKCGHCAEAMAKIAPEAVFKQLMGILNDERATTNRGAEVAAA